MEIVSSFGVVYVKVVRSQEIHDNSIFEINFAIVNILRTVLIFFLFSCVLFPSPLVFIWEWGHMYVLLPLNFPEIIHDCLENRNLIVDQCF